MKSKLSIFLILFFSILHLLDLNDKFLYNVFYLKSSSLDFKELNSKKEFKEIKKIKKNLSGITYSPKTDSLFAITNSPRDIYELSKNGEIIRKILLTGFADTEDITYIKDNLFAVLDERTSSFYIVKIDKETTKIDIKDAKKVFTHKVKSFKNFGYEGITYNQKDDEFILVNERTPKVIVSVKGIFTKDKITIETKDEILKNNYYLGDFSAIYYNEKDENFLLLSEESTLLAKVNKKGEFINYFNFKDSYISSKMTHPEGVTMDKDQNVYVVSEPNLFLSIKKD